VAESVAPFTACESRYPTHDTGTVQEARAMLTKHGVPEFALAKYLGGNTARHWELG